MLVQSLVRALGIGMLTIGLFAGCQKKQDDAPAPTPVKQEMRVKINGQVYVWSCRRGQSNNGRDYQQIVGGDPQGQAGIIVTFVRQTRVTGPEPYLAQYGSVTLNGVEHPITGISNSTASTSWLQGELLSNEQANTYSGTFKGEDSKAQVVIEDGEFTTTIH